MFDWILQNKDWLFSGVAISLPIFAISWFIRKRVLEKKQVQTGGDNSVNIQVGGNLKMGDKNKLGKNGDS